uniref:J domain-containing protein n=1 Tax=Chromera velia CCMP2878 TaxID=1169474 RepID=A0A0G4FXH6_9ALVE|eukprot:Cvel_19124.t1-p1 / transcript=Cvel_19124.t1 / gene=Cvel_19124 / organism=Chromera_velia_CCMP2878 / gene_product=Chaperone protein dnaJ 6, putative / transcript_product=Chaperone protein dnaJ 6, putative / location=Cvel_scaffold1625:10908-12683(-) / protein_length=323 / sequence_SO=supercontig / SO=protein_coding / is_pseudo=false
MVKDTQLYDELGVSTDASKGDICRAYRTKALLVHPDKNPDDPKATENFQKLTQAFEILKDEKKRKTYDTTGRFGEDGGLPEGESLWPVVQTEDIEAFEEGYRGSQEEEEDLCQFFNKKKGNVATIFEHILCSRPSDGPRFLAFFVECLETGRLERPKGFSVDTLESQLQTSATKYVQQLRKDKKHLKKMQQEKGGKGKENGGGSANKGKGKAGAGGDADSSMASLVAQIRSKPRQGFMDLDALAEKYGAVGGEGKGKGKGGSSSSSSSNAVAVRGKGKGGKGSDLPPPPSEEEFLAAREKLLGGKGKEKEMAGGHKQKRRKVE